MTRLRNVANSNKTYERLKIATEFYLATTTSINCLQLSELDNAFHPNHFRRSQPRLLFDETNYLKKRKAPR